MNRQAATATLISVVLALAGAAAPRSLDAAFGNTILSTYPDGRTGELWLHPDGGYTAEGRRGDPSSGRWSTKGRKLCLRQSRPMPSFISFCTALPKGGLDAGWTTKAVTGETITVKLVRGHAKGRQGPPT
jgi:hypothetical protein